MSLIWKCDRCGKVFEKNNRTFRPHEIIGGPNGKQTADLCDKCNDMLEVFLGCKDSVVAYPDHLTKNKEWYKALDSESKNGMFYFKMGKKFDAPDMADSADSAVANKHYPSSLEEDGSIPITIVDGVKKEKGDQNDKV